MKTYKKPDLNAPRYRPSRLVILNSELFERFKQDNPKYSSISFSQFKNVINLFNETIWKKVIEYRDGVELPEQLGYMFIGTCERRKRLIAIDHKKSEMYGVHLQTMNWESDQHVAKIFYTNFETKYRFKNHDLWGFVAYRSFKRQVAATYPKEWKKYVVVDNLTKVSRLFRYQKEKDQKIQDDTLLLENYDEFNLD